MLPHLPGFRHRDPLGPVDARVTAEGIGQSADGIVYDLAGNSATDGITGINIDKTAPVITAGIPQGTAGNNGWWRSDEQFHLMQRIIYQDLVQMVHYKKLLLHRPLQEKAQI